MKWCGRSVVLLSISMALLPPARSRAQITIEKPLHRSGLSGYVTDKVGKVIPGAEVRLRRHDQVDFKTSSDPQGWFDIKGAHGNYVPQGLKTGYSGGGRPVKIGISLLALAHGKTIFVMLPQAG